MYLIFRRYHVILIYFKKRTSYEAPKLRLMEMHANENIVMKDSEAKVWHNFSEELSIDLLIVVLIITDFVFISNN